MLTMNDRFQAEGFVFPVFCASRRGKGKWPEQSLNRIGSIHASLLPVP